MKYLGVDFGLKRIGLAISDGELATPWQVVEVKSFIDAVNKIVQLVSRENFEAIIVGLPEGETGKKVAKFVAALKQQGVKVKTADETLSTKEAVHGMIAVGIGKKKRQVNDAYSAAIILQNYLDRKS